MKVALAALVTAACSLPAGAAGILDAAVSKKLAERFKAIRKAGDPVTMTELAKTYPTPAKGQNAAVLLNRAFELMKKIEPREGLHPLLPLEGHAELPDVDVELPPAMRRAIREYLEDYAKVLKLLHQAAQRKGCKFDLDFTKGPALELRHLAAMRRSMRLLCLQVIDRTEDGKADKAAESLVAALRLGTALKNEPLLISGLVRIACDAIAVRQIERWVSRARPSAKMLERVEEAIGAEADPKFVAKLFVGERCFGIDIYQNHVLKPGAANLGALLGGGGQASLALRLLPRAYFKADMIAYIDIMNEHVAAARKPYPESFQQGARLGKNLGKRIPKLFVISRMILPALGRVFTEGQRHMARLDSARTALAVLRHRARTGKLAAKLKDLVPEFLDAVPPDPFDGKPLRYRADAAGFVIYALGENGRDDGGDTAGPNGGRAPDIGFRMRWPRAQF